MLNDADHLDRRGRILHDGGLLRTPGLFVIGLPFLRRRSSTFLSGIGRDAVERFGRILDWRSVGVHDLVTGLAEDVPPLPHARYRLVAATMTASPRHPVGHLVGDGLVRVPSAYGRDRYGAQLVPGAEVLHVGRTDHFGLLNHPRVHRALQEWLA